MANKEKFKKQQKNKTRLETLRSFMASFTLTVGAVIVAAVIIPKSPVADIINVTVFQNEVVYQIEVTDEDHALDLSTLKVVLDGQLETYTYPLQLGMNVGMFQNLRPNTSYYLQVYGSKGFGDERLASQRIVTSAGSRGAIVSYELIDTFDFHLNYQVNLLVSDEDGLYSEVNLYYAYIYLNQTNAFYETIPITETNQVIELLDVPNEHIHIHLYLEATLTQGETIILDELRFNVPFKLQTDLYIYRVSATQIQYQFYMDYYYIEDVIYQAKIYFGHMLIREADIKPSNTSHHGYESLIDFTGLKKNTSYRVVVSATYVDPHTKRTEMITLHEEEITTLADYSIEYELIHFETYIEVYIFVTDPNHYFQIPYYELYEIDDGQQFFIEDKTYGFTPGGDGKYASFTITKPGILPYHLVIGIRNQFDYSINHVIIDQTIKK